MINKLILFMIMSIFFILMNPFVIEASYTNDFDTNSAYNVEVLPIYIYGRTSLLVMSDSTLLEDLLYFNGKENIVGVLKYEANITPLAKDFLKVEITLTREFLDGSSLPLSDTFFVNTFYSEIFMVAGYEIYINLRASEDSDLISLHNFAEDTILLFHWHDNETDEPSTSVYDMEDVLNPHAGIIRRNFIGTTRNVFVNYRIPDNSGRCGFRAFDRKTLLHVNLNQGTNISVSVSISLSGVLCIREY